MGHLSMTALFLGIDVGTTYVKAAIVSPEGDVRGIGRRELPTEVFGGSRQEISVDVFAANVRNTVLGACRDAGVTPDEIGAVSYSSHANSFVLLDAYLSPLTPIVLWSDKRIVERFEEIDRLLAIPGFVETTGVGDFRDHMCIAKLVWFRRHEAATWSATRYVLTISDLLTFLLSSCLVGDTSTGALLGIWDVKHDSYWEEGLRTLGISVERFCSRKRPGVRVGRAEGSLSEQIGLSTDAVVVTGCLDQLSGAIGAGLDGVTNAVVSLGTVSAALVADDRFVAKPKIRTGPHIHNDQYYRIADDQNGARTLDWYRRQFAPEQPFDQLVHLALQVPPGSDGLVARPEVSQTRDASGFVDTRGAGDIRFGHGHYVRAIMESVSVTIWRLLILVLEGRPPGTVIAVGGGARSSGWLQILADVVDCDFVRVWRKEPAAYGAALIAQFGLSGGVRLERALEKDCETSEAERIRPGGNRRFYADWRHAYLHHIR